MDAWNARSEDDRKAVLDDISKVVGNKLAETTSPWYPGANQEQPRVEVFAAEDSGGALTIHFIADHLIYCIAQSGSDWADHYIFVGRAVLDGNARTSLTFEQVKHVSLTERQEEEYKWHESVAAIREAELAKRA